MPASSESFPPMPFIVGTGRCGTTLLRTMLDAHPLLAIPPESYFIPVAAELSPQDAADRSGRPLGTAPANSFLNAVQQSRNWAMFAIDPQELATRIGAIEPFELSTAIRAVYALYTAQFGKSRWGDKTPDYHAHMRLIERLLPEARFIHLIRDGRDVALSVRRLLERSGREPTVVNGARWWASRLQRARQEGQGVKHYLEVRYEELVREPEGTLRQICELIELPWDPVVVNYAEAATAEDGEDGYRSSRTIDRHVRKASTKPPTTNRIERWRTEMTAEQRDEVEAIIGPLLRELGYEE